VPKGVEPALSRSVISATAKERINSGELAMPITILPLGSSHISAAPAALPDGTIVEAELKKASYESLCAAGMFSILGRWAAVCSHDRFQRSTAAVLARCGQPRGQFFLINSSTNLLTVTPFACAAAFSWVRNSCVSRTPINAVLPFLGLRPAPSRRPP
jgi:hypothetical protein